MVLAEGTALPLVQVTVGHLRFPLGHLQYDDDGPFTVSDSLHCTGAAPPRGPWSECHAVWHVPVASAGCECGSGCGFRLTARCPVRPSAPQLSGEVIAGIAAGAAVLVLASLLILLVYRRKSTQVEREYKRIQIQMDTLENNIRSECKQAFAAMCTWDSRRAGRDPLAAASAADLPAQLSSLADTFNPDEVDCLEQRDFLVKVN